MTTDALIDGFEQDDAAAARELRDRLDAAQRSRQGQSDRAPTAALLGADDSLWQSLPVSEQTVDNAFRTAAGMHAEPLLGAFPDQVEQQSVIAGGQTRREVRVFVVNSSETPTLPPISLRLGVVQSGGTPSPALIARVED